MNKALKYKKFITKEEINNFELDKYTGEIVMVETKSALEKANETQNQTSYCRPDRGCYFGPNPYYCQRSYSYPVMEP